MRRLFWVASVACCVSASPDSAGKPSRLCHDPADWEWADADWRWYEHLVPCEGLLVDGAEGPLP